LFHAGERVTAAPPHTENRQPQLLPDWDDLRYLLAVSQHGSLTRAANALGLTQPTVSRRIERLELSMGVRLIDRSHSGAALTVEGQRIVEELHIAHGAITRAVRAASTPTLRMQDVTLLMTDGLAAYWLPHFVPRLLERHPEIELRVYATSDAGSRQRGEYDLSIHYIQPTEPNLVTTRLGTLHFLPYASPAYLARAGRPQTLGDLTRHRLLDYVLYLIDKGTWMTRLPALAGEARAQFFTNSSAALCEMVRGGAGIALLPTYVSVFESDLEPIEVDLRFETPFWLCYEQDALAKSGVRNAIQFFKQIFNRRTMPWFGEPFISPSQFRPTTAADILACSTSARE
jgi:DNA-binding transcriptional LysR family regulator